MTALPNTPVMNQYAALKQANSGALLMFRMGDFYELFGDDAITAAEVLNITLTRRRTAKEGDEGIPMCGVPYHAAEAYIGKLIEAGHRVALAEQTESPEEAKKARGSSALIQRDVIRLYTPGTLTEESYLPSHQSRVLVAAHSTSAVAWLDVSTGETGLIPTTPHTLASTLASLPVGEIVVDPTDESAVLALGIVARRQVSVQHGLFAEQRATDTLKRAYGVTTLAGLGLTEPALIRALGAVVAYAELTQLGRLPALKVPQLTQHTTLLQLDVQTRKNLELTESLYGKRADSLLGVLDQCITGAGSRLIARWVAEPRTDLPTIHARQSSIGGAVKDAATRTQIRTTLRQTGDVARCVSRLLLGRGSPRDLSVLRSTGEALPTLLAQVNKLSGPLWPTISHGLSGLAPLTSLLSIALVDEPVPALKRDGGYIRSGFNPTLDKHRTLQAHGTDLLTQMEQTEAQAAQIPALKIRYNKVWGYYIELTKAQATSIPTHFIHRQTTTSTHRYTTTALMQLERDLAGAEASALAQEEALFEQLVADVQKASIPLLAAAESLATLDVLTTLAEVAQRHGYTCPTVEESTALHIIGGKHPVVAPRVPDFVPNDTDLTTQKLWLLTGPNMAGKSTFLRQTALLTLMAHMGSWVPATSMRVGITDAIFSRIGAADNLAAGQSTFMVEMTETAQILNRATPQSLVILDELGRGTATYDGLAIAWACVEDLAQRLHSRTLFATHYHELTSLTATLPSIATHQMAVKEWKGDIVFLHQVQPGAAVGSFGVQVARLAGVPPHVTQRAATLLTSFLKVAKAHGVVKLDELSLFSHPTQESSKQPNPIEQALAGLDVDNLSPRAAWDELSRLQKLAQQA